MPERRWSSSPRSRRQYTAFMEFTLTALELPVRIRPGRSMTDEDLLSFCAANDILRIEREANGELTVMSPTGTGTAHTDSEINYQLHRWARETNAGVVFGPSAGFRLPDGSMRSPDASLASWSRWNALTDQQRQRGFAPLCPEFVIELRSPSDQLGELQEKMGHWLQNGVQLGWLLDPESRRVEVYRLGTTQPDVLDGVTAVYGDGPVAGFVLEMAQIWR